MKFRMKPLKVNENILYAILHQLPDYAETNACHSPFKKILPDF